MCNIDNIIDMLDWNNSDEIQQKGIKLAKNINSINVFILPVNPRQGKNVWGNCAKILAEKSDEVLNPYLSQLLEWLEDLNWPGAWIILERLIKYSDIETLSRHVERYVKKKVACGTWEELSALDHMCRIIENEKLKVALSAETLEVLQKHYNDPGWWDTE